MAGFYFAAQIMAFNSRQTGG